MVCQIKFYRKEKTKMSRNDVMYDEEFVRRYMKKIDEAGVPVAHKIYAVKQINAVFEVIADALAEGRSVRRQNFGKFEPRYRQSRKGLNPQTGEPLTIPASRNVGFTVGKKLHERIADVQFEKDTHGHFKPIAK